MGEKLAIAGFFSFTILTYRACSKPYKFSQTKKFF